MRSLFLVKTMLLFLLLVPGLFGCRHAPENKVVKPGVSFEVQGFDPMTNMAGNATSREICLDYTRAITDGFVIPSTQQTGDGFFHFSFSLKNLDAKSCIYGYKIYYQDESYKFPERDPADSLKQNPFAAENFYGSWEEVGKTFQMTPEIPPDGQWHSFGDRFRIVGNPRDEQRYYSNGKNDRWKRNPRVGTYRFMLVVTRKENIDGTDIPVAIRNIGQTDNGTFMNPFFYFLYGKGKDLPGTLTTVAPSELIVTAKPDLGAGIYINPESFPSADRETGNRGNCGSSSFLYENASFSQFIHYIDPATKYSNIPVIADVLKEGYSHRDYNWNRSFYRKDELITMTSTTAEQPCETVFSDPETHSIVMKNPAARFGKWKKENVGIITRHGLTYGKYTVRAKLTELLNLEGMWNGLTNAIWLITMSEAEWNYRRDCNSTGYMANYYGTKGNNRVKNTGYSEIDFEILKTVPYCPGYVLPPAYYVPFADQHDIARWDIPFPEEIEGMKDKIQVACTNWDMACMDPEDYAAGCSPVVYGDKVFWAHRWDSTYRAVTTKSTEPDDELFGGQWYYFQIDWQPEQIIWRIGPSKDKLRVVGYVNTSITSIPDNQMLLIISQEFHNTKWWVGSMFSQDNIPFPKNDIFGEVYELTIE